MKGTNKEILPDISNIKSHETYTLPSKGLVYKPEDNIPASITLRRMTTKEDKIRMRNASEEEIRKEILQACITDQGIQAGKLCLEDANFLMFRLRSLSLLDDTYKIPCFCTGCQTNFINEIELSKIHINYLNKKDLELLNIELPISKAKINLKYPTLDDMRVINEKIRAYFAEFPNADKGEVIYTVSAIVYIDKINGNKLLTEEVEDWLDALDIIDNRELRKVINILDDKIGIDTTITTNCPTCGREIVHGIPLTSELFKPSH